MRHQSLELLVPIILGPGQTLVNLLGDEDSTSGILDGPKNPDGDLSVALEVCCETSKGR
jgi:hypothetical protein